jgi:general secretion pathway protein A
MYRAFFGLRERPFDLTPNPRFLVLTDAHREALSNLEYGIASRKGITVLLGEAGTGKTTLIRSALQRQSEQVHCVHLHNPSLTRSEFVEILAAGFQLSSEARTSKAALLIELEASLREQHGRGESSVLIVDEAQTIPLEILEEIRLLANIETDETKLLSVVLAGQPELSVRLNNESLRQLKQRVALRCELRPLNLAEAAAYVAGRIRAAGGVGAQVFTREAVVLMHQRAGGIPRTVSVIADNALLTAYALAQKPVKTETIAEVCRDLDLRASGNGAGPEAFPSESAPDERTKPSSAAPRVLAFDVPEPDKNANEHPASVQPATKVDMFSSLARKRRRFSLFWNVGSR